MRDSCIFYRSFYESIKDLPIEEQAIIYNAIFSYSLDFQLPELKGISKSIFTLIKPQIDANIKRYNNGTIPKQKQTTSKTEAKQKQDKSEVEANVNDNVNVNVNVNVNENENKNVNENKNQSFVDCEILIYPTFDDFWNSYDKKVGDIEKIKIKFNKLSQESKNKIMDYIPRYKQAQPDKKFRKNPDTFLNNKSWNDEIVGDAKNDSWFENTLQQFNNR